VVAVLLIAAQAVIIWLVSDEELKTCSTICSPQLPIFLPRERYTGLPGVHP